MAGWANRVLGTYGRFLWSPIRARNNVFSVYNIFLKGRAAYVFRSGFICIGNIVLSRNPICGHGPKNLAFFLTFSLRFSSLAPFLPSFFHASHRCGSTLVADFFAKLIVCILHTCVFMHLLLCFDIRPEFPHTNACNSPMRSAVKIRKVQTVGNVTAFDERRQGWRLSINSMKQV